jgi:hypothetical protein
VLFEIVVVLGAAVCSDSVDRRDVDALIGGGSSIVRHGVRDGFFHWASG